VSVNSRLERAVLAEMAIRERRGRRRDRSHAAPSLAQRLHTGSQDLLAHLRRVASAVPRRFRAVAWLHHAHEADAAPRVLAAAGLTTEEVAALELLANAVATACDRPTVERARALSKAPGSAGYIARVVARAAIEDRLEGARPEGETLTALLLLPDPRLAR
jgi:hypothetical protein